MCKSPKKEIIIIISLFFEKFGFFFSGWEYMGMIAPHNGNRFPISSLFLYH